MPADRSSWGLAASTGLLLASLAATPHAAHANGAAEARSGGLPAGWRVQGTATMRFLGLPVYDATLTAPAALSPEAWPSQPLALTLQYHRSLSGAAIAERSLQEMRRGGAIADAQAARWLAFMKASFRDVAAGDRIVGQWWPAAGKVIVQVNDDAPRELVDAEFGTRFFGIWLATHTSEPALRSRLLGSS
jgi:hypothetical protein